ncbi:UNVERIFIED_CONTAM: hypothetical protein FKN15_064591 [Acipenser sinensis]
MEFDEVFADFSPSSRPDCISGRSSLSLPGFGSMSSASVKTRFSQEPAAVLSPVTNLALNMNNLAVLGSQCDTPKRRTNVPLLKMPSFASDTSDAGLCLDSPSPIDPIDYEETFERAILESGKVIKDNKAPIRRINSLPVTLGSSPALKGKDSDSPDFRVFGVRSNEVSRGNKENMQEGFEFKKPTQPVSRCRLRTFHGGEGKEAFALRPNSAPALMFSPSVEHKYPVDDNSPVLLRRSSLTCSFNDEDDDGFLDIMDDDVENDADVPTGMASLLTAPLVRKKEEDPDCALLIRSRPRTLFRSPSLPCSATRPALKRPERPRDECSPVKIKRRKSLAGSVAREEDEDEEAQAVKSQFLQRSKSFCEVEIELLLDNDIKELIGDFTKPFVLPTVEGKHQDLKYITSEMMMAALTGKFDDLVELIVIIDCRYPYEFEGGHIEVTLGSSPALKGKDSDSPDFRVFGVRSNEVSRGNKENMQEGFEFKKPTQPVSRCRLRTFHGGEGKEAFALRPNSAPALMFSPSVEHKYPVDDNSPVLLRRSSLTCSFNDEDDDGFLDIMDDDVENDADVPTGMASLLTAPLVRKKEEDPDCALLIRSRPRTLFRSPSLPCSATRPALKRPERPRDECSPVKIKRRKSLAGSVAREEDEDEEAQAVKSQFLQRSKSFCEVEIELLLDNDIKELIGDFTKPFVLPTVEGKHQDLKYITSEMASNLKMMAALTGKFDDLVELIVIIDCRYPYEFEGGHIEGAVNLHMEEQVEDYLLKQPITPCTPGKRVLLVFHCEFSSERGPRMCRFVREKDRIINLYPNLYYPELYILKGGYKEFFPKFQNQCRPQSYRPMHHEDFKEDLRKFRLKSRTWAGERSKRDLYSRLKKL